MTDYTPEALEALAATCRMKHRAEAANTPHGVMPSGEFAKIATALTTIADKLRTGQLVPAQPSGDEVEAVARAICKADWDADRLDEWETAEQAFYFARATAAITALDAVRGKQ